MTQFTSKENLQTCLEIFCKYMQDKQGIIITKKEFSDVKKHMYETMRGLEASRKGESMQELNMTVLVKVKEAFFKKKNIQPSAKTNVMSLERECQVFGPRDLRVNELIPKNNPYVRKAQMQERMQHPIDEDTSVELDKVVNERAQLTNKPMPDITKVTQQHIEEAEDPDMFLKRLKNLEDTRIAIDHNIEREFREKNNIQTLDPKAYFTNQTSAPKPAEDTPNLNLQVNLQSKNSQQTQPSSEQFNNVGTSRQELLIPPPGGFPAPFAHQEMNLNMMYNDPLSSGSKVPSQQQSTSQTSYITIPKYISINSVDRNWANDVKRYQYSVAFNGGSGDAAGALSKTFKNIRSIQVGKVIIPDEIMENYNIKALAPSRTAFNHEFSFSYPYLILQVAELDDVYDGTNDAIRKSFCKLVYNRSYKAPNGRGYVILKPLQCEKKLFHPSPLSSLNRLSVSILKPNGFLLNDSSDSYKIWKVDYDPFNPHYYQIVTDVFFDKNEFFIGDVIVFRGFSMKLTSQNAPAPTNEQSTLMDYINRPEGHEILQIGAVNTNGFWRSFFIKAIGVFNRAVGQFEVNTNVVDGLNTYNDSINYVNRTETNGSILNTSLQNTIGMSVEVMMNNTAGHIDTLLV